MIIKEVITSAEKQKIVNFLAEFDLRYENNIDQTIYIEEDDVVVGTVSVAGYIIKCLAVRADRQSENLAVTLVGDIIKRLHSNNVYYYQVFTKPQYKQVFESFGFQPLIQTDKVCVLEGGDGSISEEIKRIKTRMAFNLDLDMTADNDVACVVLNGNPFTEGHLFLVEKAAAEHDYCVVFVLEEEGSYFSFKERYALAYLSCKPLKNVMVIPSTKYVVSKGTFPSYFLKTADESTEQYALYDAKIFAEHFMPELGIKARYVGSEVTDYMSVYNQALKSVLGDKLQLVPRMKMDGEEVSAKKVRALIEQGNNFDAARYVPTAVRSMFLAMLSERNV